MVPLRFRSHLIDTRPVTSAVATPFPVITAMVGAAIMAAAPAHADNRRLNNGVLSIVYTIQHQRRCTNDIRSNPQLRLAAQWHVGSLGRLTSFG